ncbi:MAG: Inositol 2-dehydrogenase/D-chiro-inositol 3-dehydrogenase [Acidobacteria bacterium]|nr:Inositol 2-dehydrogenase/D-chiro-inositol 3-dehydrogenase [Acidobacteriota bacterium]
MGEMTRRNFAKTAAVASVTTALSYSNIIGSNDRVRLGFIALGNRGDQVLDAFLAHKDCEVTAVCDIYQPYMDFASKKIGSNPKQFKDYRKLLELKGVDAAVICTPDHWHALQTIQACQAGKDVYVEKPLSLTVAEGRKMVEAARKYNRVTQVGINRRSSQFVREAADIVRSGYIGKIMSVRAFHIQNEWPKGIGNPPNENPPADFDWEAWLGPAPKKAYNKNRTFYRFRWFWDYSGGQLTNFGVHYLDTIHLALGQDTPTAVTAMGGKFAIEDNREIPDTMEVLWQYPGGTLVTFTQINANAAPASLSNTVDVEFRGTKGTLYLKGSSYEVVPDNISPNEFFARSPLNRANDNWRKGSQPMIEAKSGRGDADTKHHARNFLDCVRSRKETNCDIEVGHRSTSAPLIGNIAYKMKAFLEWDGKAERFTNNAAANKLLSYQYRAPHKFTATV